MFKYDVLCVGSATVDNYLTSVTPLSKINVGDKVLVSSLEKHSGGGATNAAAALSKLGLKTKVLTKLGSKHDSEFVEKELKLFNIKNICRHKSSKNTDNATIISSLKEKDRIIYVHKGASRDLSTRDFKVSDLNCRWIYLGSLVGKSFNIIKKLVEVSEKKKIKILFNPSLYVAKKGKNHLRKILEVSDILILNKEEAKSLLNTKENKIVFLLRSLKKLGPKIVIITNGRRALYGLHEKKLCSLTPPNVNRVHTAGAGDAFNAGFLAGIIKGYTFEGSLMLGQVISSSIIQHIGTKNKLLNEREASLMMKKYRMKVTKRRC